MRHRKHRSLTHDLTRQLYLGGGVIVFAAVCLVAWYISSGPSRVADPRGNGGAVATSTATVSASCDYRRRLDGVCVSSEVDTTPAIIGVMIENHVDARPQSGLAQASVVYEAPVEANITRFLAIFPATASVIKVGPVRSARPYYLDWLGEYPGARYMHVGGSPDALERIVQEKVFDLNEFFHGWYYWRSTDRSAPHNVYTSSKLWQKALADAGSSMTSDIVPWTFQDTAPCEGAGCVATVTVSFAPPAYKAVWKYDAASGRYVRYQSGVPHRDADGTEISASTVIVVETKTRVLDDKGRLSLTAVGTGTATVVRDGISTSGTWQKKTATSRMQFLDSDGKQIPLKAGPLWIEVVPQDGTVAYE